MSEEQLNIKYICENTGLVENDKLIPIILGMIKDSYKAGLTQAEIDNTMGLIEENQELKKQLEELEFIVGLRQKRNLISKFDKEYDEEDKKKNPNRDYACVTPDAEEVYKRYYELKAQQKEFIKYLEDEISELSVCWKDASCIAEEILSKYKEIIGSDL